MNQLTNFANTPTPNVVNLGTCWGTPSGQDLSMPSYMASGNQCVAEAVLRRWSTDPGGLIDDPNYGYNLTNLLSADLSPTDIAYAQQQASAQAELDERVLRCVCTITLTADGLLTVNATITTANGPFRLVVAVSANPPPGTPNVQLLLVST
jgi:phage baseplate assembly protein W